MHRLYLCDAFSATAAVSPAAASAARAAPSAVRASPSAVSASSRDRRLALAA